MDGTDGTIRIGTWNTAWRVPNRRIGQNIRGKLAAAGCHVLCVTEGFEGILPDGGHVIDAGPNWGCPIKKGRRKVLLWSEQPWTLHTHAFGLEGFHEGRFVAGTTEAAGVCLTVIGVCIPWWGSHVKSCMKNLKPWADHKRWLEGFEKLRCRFPRERTVVLGDFNQTNPRTRAPKDINQALEDAFKGFTFATNGVFFGCLMAIDHIVHTPDLTLPRGSVEFWPKYDDGLKLSDHCGVRGMLHVS